MYIDKKFEVPLTLFIMVLIMTSVITFVSISINHGVGQEFIIVWLKMWAMAFIMAYPLVLVIISPIKRFVSKCIKK